MAIDGFEGWICPKCGGVYSPLQRYCPKCSPDSNVFFVIPEDPMPPTQMRELQDALHAITTSLDWKHKLIVLPSSSKIISEFNV